MKPLGLVDGQLKRSALIAVHDVTVTAAALPVAVVLVDPRLATPALAREVLALLPWMVAAAVLATAVFKPYRALWRRLASTELLNLGRFVTASIVVFAAMLAVTGRWGTLPPSAPVVQLLVALVALAGTRLAYERYRRHRDRAGDTAGDGPVLLVGAGDGAALVIEMMRGRVDQGGIAGIVDDGIDAGRHLAGVPVLGKLADFDGVVARLRVEGRKPARVIITRPHHQIGRAAVYALMARAQGAGVRVEQLPDAVRLIGVPGDGARPPAVAPPPAAPVAPIKRLVDVLVAGGVLVLCSPLVALAGAAVALGVQRPILFTQMRPGLGGRPYRLVKLRTMRDPIDAHGRRLTDAERTPWVGRVLRRARLDELPQVWNVLVGDMSLIGPRPLLASDLDAMPDGGRARSSVRPGITGWAQVNGGHQLTADEKLALDLWYAANADMRLDLLILWRTMLMVLFGERRQPAAIADARASLPARELAAAK